MFSQNTCNNTELPVICGARSGEWVHQKPTIQTCTLYALDFCTCIAMPGFSIAKNYSEGEARMFTRCQNDIGACTRGRTCNVTPPGGCT